jgi:hypothetical protein
VCLSLCPYSNCPGQNCSSANSVLWTKALLVFVNTSVVFHTIAVWHVVCISVVRYVSNSVMRSTRIGRRPGCGPKDQSSYNSPDCMALLGYNHSSDTPSYPATLPPTRLVYDTTRAPAVCLTLRIHRHCLHAVLSQFNCATSAHRVLHMFQRCPVDFETQLGVFDQIHAHMEKFLKSPTSTSLHFWSIYGRRRQPTNYAPHSFCTLQTRHCRGRVCHWNDLTSGCSPSSANYYRAHSSAS